MEKKTYLDNILSVVIEKVKKFENDSRMAYIGFINWLRNILRTNGFDQEMAGVIYIYLLNTGYVVEQKDSEDIIINPSQ